MVRVVCIAGTQRLGEKYMNPSYKNKFTGWSNNLLRILSGEEYLQTHHINKIRVKSEENKSRGGPSGHMPSLARPKKDK